MKQLFISFLTFFIVGQLFAQSIEINGVSGDKFSGVYPIASGTNGEVDGYYTYYLVERGEKGMRVFEFAIVDKNLGNKVLAQIEMHRSASINDVVFNGKYLLVSFDDPKNKKIVTQVLDLKGTTFAKDEFLTEKRKFTSSTAYPSNDGEGFFIVRPDGEKANGYSLQFLGNDLKEKWKTSEVPPKGSEKSIDDLINSNGRIIIWEEYNKNRKLKPLIVAIDIKTGARIYEYDCFDGTSTILNNKLRVEPDGSLFAGGSYVDGEKYRDVNNAGIYVLKLDKDGKKVLYNKVSNEEKIQKALMAISKGMRVGSNDKVFVEDLVISNDKIYVISEMFSKNMNMTPVGIQQMRDLLTGKYVGWAQNDHNEKSVFEIKDFILFTFDMGGKLEEIKPLKKQEYNKITVWYPYTGYGGMALARMMSRWGWFDYNFSTTNSQGQKVLVVKNNATEGKPDVNIYTLDKTYSYKQIDLKQESKVDLDKGSVGYFGVLQNTKGKILAAYYQKKLQRITLNLESIE